jgi:hypothetical protein
VPNKFGTKSAGGPRHWTAACSALEVVLSLCLILGGQAILGADDPAVKLRERYLGPGGLPSETSYARSQGILPVPGAESFAWQAMFRLTYRSSDLARGSDARALHTDCYFIRTRKFVAPTRVQPVWDGRVYRANDRLAVAAYTTKGERVFGYIDEQSRVVRSEDADNSIAMPDLNKVHYNPFTGQLWNPVPGGDIEEQQRFYLPLPLVNLRGELVRPEFRIVPTTAKEFALVASSGGSEVTLATCVLDTGAGTKRTRGYAPVLGPGCSMATDEPTTIFDVAGKIATDILDAQGAHLVLRSNMESPPVKMPAIRIDGRFDEWRSLRGVTDSEGDTVSYLQYNPDTDLLEFKVTNDDEYLYFYTRVAGRHGNTAKGRDRYYFYVYIDADRDAATGYLPSRDDDCYYGVTLGDDCEAQYEFVGGRFVKSFFGFAGRSTEKDILAGRVTLGPSWYKRHDDQGRLRDGYKVEYIRRAGEISITEDLSEGTSDDISVALSPDGSECEMRAAMSGFLRTSDGTPIIAVGQRIDLAAGVEASGEIQGKSKWGADSTVVLRGYSIAK